MVGLKNKKGYVYFIEIIIIIVLLGIIFTSFVESEQRVFEYKQQENLRNTGYGVLHNLDKINVLGPALAAKNFTRIRGYIEESISKTDGFDIDYINATGCYSVNATSLSGHQTYCNATNASTQNTIVSTYYTYSRNNTPQTIRIYLWRKL